MAHARGHQENPQGGHDDAGDTARLRACTQSVHARHRSAGPCGRRQLADKWQFGKRQSHELLRRGRAELGAQSGPEARITVSAVKYRKSVVIPTPTRKVIHGGPACNASRARVDNRENAVGPAWHGSSAGIAADPTPGRVGQPSAGPAPEALKSMYIRVAEGRGAVAPLCSAAAFSRQLV